MVSGLVLKDPALMYLANIECTLQPITQFNPILSVPIHASHCNLTIFIESLQIPSNRGYYILALSGKKISVNHIIL